MSLAASLNWLWLFIACSALVLVAVAERFGASRVRLGRPRRFLSVVLVALSLFPCVSVSDDLLGFSCFSYFKSAAGAASSDRPAAPFSSGSSSQSSEEASSRTLIRLLLSLDSLRVVGAFILAVSWGCFGFVVLARSRRYCLLVPSLSGRAPPAFAY